MNFRVCSSERLSDFPKLGTIGAQMTDMDQILTLKCCYSCGRVYLSAAASASLMAFTQGLQAINLQVQLRVMFDG
jgi:hypothetical protein